MKRKHYYMTQEFLDEIFEQVCAYQSEHKTNIKQTCAALAPKYGVATHTFEKWMYLAKGKNRVIHTVAKKKTVKKQPVKLAATSVSSSAYAQMQAEKIIFDYMKGLSLFKRILACICGFDKLCMNYGSKKVF